MGMVMAMVVGGDGNNGDEMNGDGGEDGDGDGDGNLDDRQDLTIHDRMRLD